MRNREEIARTMDDERLQRMKKVIGVVHKWSTARSEAVCCRRRQKTGRRTGLLVVY